MTPHKPAPDKLTAFLLFLLLLTLLHAACVPKTPPPTIFSEPFPREEPKPRPAPTADVANACIAADAQPGLVVDCSGLLVPDSLIERCRYNEAERTFWEEEARAQWSGRTIDRALCNDRYRAVAWEADELRKTDRLARIATPFAFAGGVAVGAGAAVLIVRAVALGLETQPE